MKLRILQQKANPDTEGIDTTVMKFLVQSIRCFMHTFLWYVTVGHYAEYSHFVCNEIDLYKVLKSFMHK